MQRLDVSGAVRPLYESLGVKELSRRVYVSIGIVRLWNGKVVTYLAKIY